MRWIANYVVDSLCFAIDKLQLGDSGASSIVQLLWEVLDLFGDCADEVNDRYKKLQNGLRRLFDDKVLTAAQVQ